MKKIVLFLLLVLSCFSVKNVKAKSTNLVMEENTNIYYAMYNNDFYRSFSFFRYFQDGKRVYCIDPDQKVTTNTYEEVKDYSALSSEVLDKITLIGYFGTDYPGHNTLEYELATQALIWEEIKGVTVRWYTERYSYGTEIDVSNERREIQRLIQEYYIKPELSHRSISANINDCVQIFDGNHVLANYEIVSFDGGQAIIENDEIKMRLTGKVGDYKLVLRRKKYDYDHTTYYLANSSQAMMRGRMKDEYIEIPVEIHSGIVQLKKYGIQLDDTQKLLSNVTFELRAGKNFYYHDGSSRYRKDDLIGIYKTNENGFLELELPYGEYYLVETKTNDNYVIGSEFYPFKIGKENTFVELEVQNQMKYASVVLHKKDKDTEEHLSGVTFLITNLDTKEEFKVVTNEEGVVTLSKLPLGTYMIKEIETLPNYILSEEVKILELKEHQEEVTYTFYNEKVPEIPDTDCYDFSNFYILLGGFFLFHGIKKH